MAISKFLKKKANQVKEKIKKIANVEQATKAKKNNIQQTQKKIDLMKYKRLKEKNPNLFNENKK